MWTCSVLPHRTTFHIELLKFCILDTNWHTACPAASCLRLRARLSFLFSILHQYFLSPEAGSCHGKPKGSQDQADQSANGHHSRLAVYRKRTTSLLCSTSIKGHSVDNFLEGVMELTHTYRAPQHKPDVHTPFCQWGNIKHLILVQTVASLQFSRSKTCFLVYRKCK